jgi:hypothetical protein
MKRRSRINYTAQEPKFGYYIPKQTSLDELSRSSSKILKLFIFN